MSYSTRASRYANAALVAEVSPERGDFDGYAEPGGGGGARGGRAADGTLSPLAGVWLQEHWERAVSTCTQSQKVAWEKQRKQK